MTRLPLPFRAAAAAFLFGGCLAGAAQAQPAAPPAVQAPPPYERAVAVEIAIVPSADGVTCRPPEARLPPQTPIRLQIVNSGDQDAVFRAPEFFAAGEVVSVVDASYEQAAGAVSVPRGVIGQLVMTTGPRGRYGYACHGAAEAIAPGAPAQGGEFEVDQ